MEINYKVLDKILLDLASLQDGQISGECEQQIYSYVKDHDMNVFSDNSLRQLYYAFAGSLCEVYAAITGDYLPNIFVRMEDYGNEVK